MATQWTLLTKNDFTLDFAHGKVTCPNDQTGPMIPGRDAPFLARVCDTCPLRAQCTTAKLGHGRSLTIREDEPFQHQLRAKLKTKRGRAALRKRTAVEHAISHHLCIKGGAPAIRGCARTSLTAGVMRQSATSRWLHVMRRNVDSLPEVPPN